MRRLILAASGATLAASLGVVWLTGGFSRTSAPRHGAADVLAAIRAQHAGWCAPSEQVPVAMVDGPRMIAGTWVTFCDTLAGSEQGSECVAVRDTTLEIIDDQAASAPRPTPLGRPQCGDAANGTPGAKTPRPTQTAAPLKTPIAVSDLVAPVQGAGFDVSFAWKQGIPAQETGFVAWRQNGGARRFDYEPGGAKNPESGWFSLEDGLAGAAQYSRSPSVRYCVWFGERAGAVSVTCGAPPTLSLESAMFAALKAQAIGKLQDRQIAGRTASCYTFDQGGAAPGIICVDHSSRAPLYLLGASPADGSLQEIEATSASVPGPTLALPTDLPGDVGIAAAPTRAAAALEFPPSITWSR